MQDELAFQSSNVQLVQLRRLFKDQIVPVEFKTQGVVVFDTDEHVRSETTLQALADTEASLQEGRCRDAGNASGINDGQRADLGVCEGVRSLGRAPVARLVAYAHAGRSAYMGIARSRRHDWLWSAPA